MNVTTAELEELRRLARLNVAERELTEEELAGLTEEEELERQADLARWREE